MVVSCEDLLDAFLLQDNAYAVRETPLSIQPTTIEWPPVY
jgi:hypothetical protein